MHFLWKKGNNFENLCLTYPCFCICCGCNSIFCHLLHIYILGTLGHFFHNWCAVYGVCKWLSTVWPAGCVHLYITLCHYHHYGDLSEIIEILKWLSGRYMLSSVCPNFLNYLLFNIWGYVPSAYSFLLWWSWKYTLSHHHHQIGSMNQ